MAIGDLGASAGLTIYPSSDKVSNGYIYANQRADDIAAVMTRVTKAEANAKLPEAIYKATPTGGSAITGPIAITDIVTVPALPYARTIRVSWSALLIQLGGNYGECSLRSGTGGTVYQSTRTSAPQNSLSGEYVMTLAANTSQAFRLYGAGIGSFDFTPDTNYTWMQVTAKVIS